MKVGNKLLISSGCLAVALLALIGQASAADSQIVKISAKRFAFTPAEITVKKGVPVTFELTTQDRSHGFAIEGTKVRTTIEPGKTTELKFTPTTSGSYNFYCDVFCGSGHDDMSGKLKVVD